MEDDGPLVTGMEEVSSRLSDDAGNVEDRPGESIRGLWASFDGVPRRVEKYVVGDGRYGEGMVGDVAAVAVAGGDGRGWTGDDGSSSGL